MDIPIPYGRQHITEKDIQAVVATLRSDYLTQGPQVPTFESAFAEYVGAKYAVAVANGTAALHLCALALGVKSGDRVITTPITFAASANCIRYCGGEVVFADIDHDTYLLSVENVRQLLQRAPRGTYQGIIPVDFAGRAVNLQAFRELANEFGLWILEDACHAPGGYFTDSQGSNHNCGSGHFADLAIFSFHPVKHIAAGEGGMITTNNEELYEKLKKLRTHGITKNSSQFVNSLELAVGCHISDKANLQEYPGWYMEMQELGFNYRLTDFQAALGHSQLQRADDGLKKRRLIANRYSIAFEGLPFIIKQSGVVKGHAYHLYIIETEHRLDLYNYLRTHKVFVQVHYIPCHLMPYYQKMGWKKGDLKRAENYYSRCLSLPMYPTLDEKSQDKVIELIKNFFNNYLRKLKR